MLKFFACSQASSQREEARSNPMRLSSSYGIVPEIFDRIGNSVNSTGQCLKHGFICYVTRPYFDNSLIIGHQKQSISMFAQLKKAVSLHPLLSYVPRCCFTQLPESVSTSIQGVC
jgi:hypothetical protein